MIDEYITLEKLGDMLDYTDDRSTKKWCYKHNIPVIRAGKKSYVLTKMVELFFRNHLEGFYKATYKNSDEIIEAINNDDLIELTKLIHAPVSEEVKKDFQSKKRHGTIAQDFLNKIKAD